MAKVFIEESTLTAIGDAIREKEGTTELILVDDMSLRISAIETGGGGDLPEEAFTITGNCTYRFGYGGWDWFINKYGNRITVTNAQSMTYMFAYSNVVKIPFVLNVSNKTDTLSNIFVGCTQLKESPKIRGPLPMSTNLNLTCLAENCNNLRDVEDLFEPEAFDALSSIKVTSAYSTFTLNGMFSRCFSLRQVPSWWYKFKLNPESTAFPSTYYVPFYNTFSSCYALNEVLNIPVWHCAGAQTSNMFDSFVSNCVRLKNFTFETNNGQPIETKWKSQTIDLTKNVGFPASSTSYFLSGNSGITKDKEVTDDASYQALKNDPDWYAFGNNPEQCLRYSRYNHDSAVETINSLPDTSAYLATAGGTNTIKFTGAAGNRTDGGAINTLTAEEIAVATAKGWTVTLV